VSSLANGGQKNNIRRFSSAAGNLVFNGGTLQYTRGAGGRDRLFYIRRLGGTVDASRTGAVNFVNAGTLVLIGFCVLELTLAGNNTGANILAAIIPDDPTSLVKNGPGTWILTGNNTYTGTTTINGGILQIGNGGTSGTLGGGDVTDNATLTFKRSDTLTV